MNPDRRRFVVLISGRGSNLQAIVEAAHRCTSAAQVVAVLSNTVQAAGLAWAEQQGIPARVVAHRDFDGREAFDHALAQAIDAWAPDYILLAGFMRILTPGFVARFQGRLINIHPSLLPAFPGLHTHEQALRAGVQWHGCSLHFVTPTLDQGPIIAQGIVPVFAQDNADALAARVLGVEHVMYAQVVEWLAQGRVELDEASGRVSVRGVDSRAFRLMPDGRVCQEGGACLS